jgi:fatty-acyl-CoA synthase
MFTRHHGVWPRELPKTMTLPQTSVFTNLEVSARRFPNHAATTYYCGTRISLPRAAG